jgi:hypothetical protein
MSHRTKLVADLGRDQRCHHLDPQRHPHRSIRMNARCSGNVAVLDVMQRALEPAGGEFTNGDRPACA